MQNTNIAAYDYCALDSVKQITAEDDKQKAIRQTKQKARQEANTVYYIKQKLSGLVMAAIGIIVPFILDGDATVSLFVLPLGLYLIFTKEKAMMF